MFSKTLDHTNKTVNYTQLMKNKLSSYGRPFKMKKYGVFLYLISAFLVPEVFTILYYANKITDDVISFASNWCKNTNSEISL